jgi:5-methylcytosine-specific restriction endonuclease McrA
MAAEGGQGAREAARREEVTRLVVCAGCMKHIPACRPALCPDCRRQKQRQRDQRRGSPSQRGYGAEWRRLRKQVIEAQPWCTFCKHTGSKDNPLSVDHIVQRQHGGTDDPSNLRVLCLSCNHQRQRGANPDAHRAPVPASPPDDGPDWSFA